MGASASGQLFFGAYFGEEDPRWPEGAYGRECPEDWDEDWEYWLANQAGLASPWDDPVAETRPQKDYSDRSLSYQERQDRYEQAMAAWEAEHADWEASLEAYWEAKQRLVEDCPVEIFTVGHHDYGLKILALTGTRVRGSFDGTVIDPDYLAIEQERIDAAEAWCKEHGVAWKDPSWLLTGSYG